MKAKDTFWAEMTGAVLVVWGLGCSGLPAFPWETTQKIPPLNTTTEGAGTITINGTATDYMLDAAQSHLFLLVKKRSATSCQLFHHHSMAALAANYTFDLRRDDPQGSTLTAEVIAHGLDPDQEAYRAEFPETQGSSFTSGERNDIRANMLNQLEASAHPLLRFTAAQLSTLDGSGNASIAVNIRGSDSQTTMDATATWTGTTLTLEGTAPLDGSAHGLPRGNFSDCVDSNMTMKMRLVLVPGTNMRSGVDASVPPFEARTFPDEQPCGELGFDDVKDVLALNCGTCHEEPQQYSATVPLHAWGNFHVNSVLYPDGPLWEDSLDRLQASDGRVMPPVPFTITMAERSLLEQWMMGGAHQFKCDGNGQPLPLQEPALTCRSNLMWGLDEDMAGFRDESMFPGTDCLSCHDTEREARGVKVAGTVFRSLHEKDRCFGWPADGGFADIVVELKGRDGVVRTLDVDRSGNFILENRDIVAPYTAAVINQVTGERRDMVGSQIIKSCNRCHTATGHNPPDTNGNPAPGRIVAPGIY